MAFGKHASTDNHHYKRESDSALLIAPMYWGKKLKLLTASLLSSDIEQAIVLATGETGESTSQQALKGEIPKFQRANAERATATIGGCLIDYPSA